MRSNLAVLIAIIGLFTLSVQPVFGSNILEAELIPICEGKLNGSVSKELETHNFKVHRGLLDYSAHLPPLFFEMLKEGAGKLWVDFGAGDGNALAEVRTKVVPTDYEINTNHYREEAKDRLKKYLTETPLSQRPLGLGITFKKRTTEIWSTPFLRMKEGLFETMQFEDEDEFWLGTDVYGIFEYTLQLDLATAKAIKLMKGLGSKLLIFVGQVDNSPEKQSPTSLQKDFVTLTDGSRIAVRDWFRRIRGPVKVEYLSNEKGRLTAVITKTSYGPIFIPQLVSVPTGPLPPGERGRSYRDFKETGKWLEILPN